MGIYEDYLMHFNPNHDPINGQFTSDQKGTVAAAKKAVKIGDSKFTPWYYKYDPLLKDRPLNRHLDSNKELIESRRRDDAARNVTNRLFDQYEMMPKNDETRSEVESRYQKYREAEIKADKAYDETHALAKRAIEEYLGEYGDIKLNSREFEILVEYAHEFYPSAPGREH